MTDACVRYRTDMDAALAEAQMGGVYLCDRTGAHRRPSPWGSAPVGHNSSPVRPGPFSTFRTFAREYAQEARRPASLIVRSSPRSIDSLRPWHGRPQARRKHVRESASSCRRGRGGSAAAPRRPSAKRGPSACQACSTPTITLLALITANAFDPTLSLSSSADAVLITETMSIPFATLIVTSALTGPSLMCLRSRDAVACTDFHANLVNGYERFDSTLAP